ncbi:FAD-dependent monooxygenase [Williamsia sp. 1135]|uniref:FAD-dependent monooxygenase n=1 Tax=Williamsia sp. 1135 TaxID=1889262 RepID=UPI00117FB2FB|nr:FAD-dependent monooxygenase [Williamsia sp. 1135]
MTTQRDPVVIVGAGPVGLVCALLLARRGVASVILERHRAPYALPRAVHLDDEVFRILQAVGIEGTFAPHTRAMPGMRLVSGRGRVMTEFARNTSEGRNGFPPDSMFDQPDLERILLDRAADVDLIDLRRGCQVTEVSRGARPVVCYQNSAGATAFIDAVAVIGCDGANSAVRAQLGVTMRDFRFDEQWLVVDVLTPAPLDVWSGVHQICDPHRAATFMPVTGNRYRWEFRVRGDDDLDALRSRIHYGICWRRGCPRPHSQSPRSCGKRRTPFGPGWHVPGATARCSSPAMPPIKHRRSSARGSDQDCAMHST